MSVQTPCTLNGELAQLRAGSAKMTGRLGRRRPSMGSSQLLASTLWAAAQSSGEGERRETETAKKSNREPETGLIDPICGCGLGAPHSTSVAMPFPAVKLTFCVHVHLY